VKALAAGALLTQRSLRPQVARIKAHILLVTEGIRELLALPPDEA
jgi:hypothetical protein